MVRYKLSEEQKELFLELMSSESFELLVTKIVPVLIEDRAHRVLTQQVDSDSDLLKLAIKRAEYEGAKRLLADLEGLKLTAKKASK